MMLPDLSAPLSFAAYDCAAAVLPVTFALFCFAAGDSSEDRE